MVPALVVAAVAFGLQLYRPHRAADHDLCTDRACDCARRNGAERQSMGHAWNHDVLCDRRLRSPVRRRPWPCDPVFAANPRQEFLPRRVFHSDDDHAAWRRLRLPHGGGPDGRPLCPGLAMGRSWRLRLGVRSMGCAGLCHHRRQLAVDTLHLYRDAGSA